MSEVCIEAGGCANGIPLPLVCRCCCTAAERTECWFLPPSLDLPSQTAAFTWLVEKAAASFPRLSAVL